MTCDLTFYVIPLHNRGGALRGHWGDDYQRRSTRKLSDRGDGNQHRQFEHNQIGALLLSEAGADGTVSLETGGLLHETAFPKSKQRLVAVQRYGYRPDEFARQRKPGNGLVVDPTNAATPWSYVGSKQTKLCVEIQDLLNRSRRKTYLPLNPQGMPQHVRGGVA